MNRAATQPQDGGQVILPTYRIWLPVVVGAIQVVGTHFAGLRQPERAELDALGILLLLIGPAALFLRDRYPVAVLAFVLATTLGYVLLDYPRGPIFLALIVAFVTAVTTGHRGAAIASLVVGYPSFLWLPYLLDLEPAPGLAQALGLLAWLLVLLTGAEIARTRRERALERARTQAEEARRRAGEERLRIARELHDVLAHNISLINVQSSVALHLMDEQPEQVRSALTAIKQASSETIGELRSVLDILREGRDVPRAPTSGLDDLDQLIHKTRGAGLKATTNIEGERRLLPPSVDVAAFRIVQEALTNVTRHAGNSQATVHIVYGDNDLTLQIDDDGPGTPAETSPGGGKGILGMRERATALNGEFAAGPRPEGGFRVWARLPLGPDRTEGGT